MELIFKRSVVNSEIDFVENGIDKINVNITVVCDLVGVNNTTEIALPLIVINLNSQTGEEMDIDRMIAINNLIANY
jgi:hypothetical protein